ncbi:male sterility protein-domain-containing protein [Daedaleopsis nitida]|nr:male sterility protein-domain-containing protein [Daedaleopsis nitida]
MESTNCGAIFVDSAISHLHVDIFRKDSANGVTPTVIGRSPVATDTTRDGLVRATAFLDKTENIAPALLQKEAAEGAIFLHTSGSTGASVGTHRVSDESTHSTSGHPKAIAWSHDFISAITAANGRDRARCNDDVLYTCFPMFHAGGICASFPFFLGSGASFVCVDSWKSVSVDTILRHLRTLKHRKVDASLPPSILEDIADSRDGESVGVLAAQNTVFWGGAPLREKAGDYLVQNGVQLVAWGGSTEAGPLARSSLEKGADPTDWMYMRLVDYYEFNWCPIPGDPHSRCNLIVSPIHTTPPVVNSLDPIGFATNDRWLQHPDSEKSHLWKPAGRIDDVTVLSNGEKTDNKQLEELLCASPHIYHAIIFGSGRFVNGAIVSPPASLLKSDFTYNEEPAVEKYLKVIWPHIDGHVNKIVPQHSRLLRGMVLVACSDRPFLISDKGTVKTKASLALYTEDIDRAYEALERGMDEGNAQSVNSLAARLSTSSTADGAAGAILPVVQEVVADALGRRLRPQDDFFRNGMDSLIATKLRTVLSAAVRRAGIDISLPRNVVYSHSTCDMLTHFLRTFVQADISPVGGASAVYTGADAFKTIDCMIAKYTQDLPTHKGTRSVPEDADVYAVTGTTGSLGAAYVAHLLEQKRVKKIYLLNRRHAERTMRQRQEAAFLDKGLDAMSLRLQVQGRVEYVEIDLEKPRLGLSDGMYSKLSSEVTCIVHNAWLLNFSLFLPSFEAHIAGLRALLDLALSSALARPPQVAFVSSIGAVARWPFSSAVPEAALNSPEFALPQGYSYSKYVSEQIVQHAISLRPILRATVIRCGQLSGSVVTGAWAKSEYIPRLLRSANELGIVPTGLAPVRWLPVDVAADILCREVGHAAAQPAPGPIRYYTLDNASHTPWRRVVDALAAFRGESHPLEEVSMSVFLDAVRQDSSSPAFEVVEYLEELLVTSPVPPLDTTQARCAAGNILDCDIGDELALKYVQYACGGCVHHGR